MQPIVRLPIVGVMGSGTESHDVSAREVGRMLAEMGVHLLTGGGQGVMAAVSRAFAETPGRKGQVIGVLPCRDDDASRPKPGYPNKWVEIAIPTHLPLSGTRGTEPLSRNHINVLSSDVIVALPGGEGTASEAALADQYNTPIIAYLGPDDEIPDLPSEVLIAKELSEVKAFVLQHLGARLDAT